MRLKDKVALVTGGGSGIGKAVCSLFAREGAQVIVNDLDEIAAKQTAAEISGEPVQADVSDSAQVARMFAEVTRISGHLDILVNNAGIAESSPSRTESNNRIFETQLTEARVGSTTRTPWNVTLETSDEEWERMIRVHLFGAFYCTREALRLLKSGGSIVNMSSVLGLRGAPGMPHYSAAKAGILGLTRSVAQEVGSLGIRINAICPGVIETPMTDRLMSDTRRGLFLSQIPVGRFGLASDVASAALFLASDESAYITGQWLSVNGGLLTV